MKKKLVTVKDFAALQDKIGKAKKQIKNELTEDAAELRRSLLELLDELENADVEVDEAELASRVREAIDAYNRDDKNDVPASVANAIASRIKELQNTMPKSEKLTAKVKNEISAAILKARGKEDVENAVNAVLVKNGITGLSFEETVDYAIADKWGDSNELFAALKKAPFTKFFYTSQEVAAVGAVAHGWSKSSQTAKAVQALTVSGKTIATQYIYKRQQVALEDLDDIRRVGNETTFLRWLNEELDRQIVNAIVHIMLGGGTGYSDITTIEALKGTGATDAFRTKVVVTDDAALTLAEARSVCDAVYNPNGKAKWAVMNQAQLTALARFKYASGGDDTFHTREEVASMLGVDKIYVTELAATVYCFLPDGYWFVEKNSLAVTYPTYEFNVINYQKERNCGAGVHDLLSVAFAAES